MPFDFTCPYCFKKTLVDDTLAGKEGPCAGCGKTVTLPSEIPTRPESAYPVDSKYVLPVAQQSPSQWKVWILKALGFGILATTLSCATLYILWPTLQSLSQRRNKVACINNMQLIAKALNEYAAEHGTYPPAVTYDSAGKPMHSWRVMILPQLGMTTLHARYKFNEPWDSASNILLVDQCPSVFVSPASSNPYGNENSYVLITGKKTLFPPSGPLGPSDVSDGTSSTLLLVDKLNAATEWTNPVDVDIAKLNPMIGASGANAIGGEHDDGATAVFADGTPAWLPEDLDPILLKAIISPNGGEPIDPNDYQLQ